ncbi:unnamed protein product, partial [Amoebophrya sp. A120]
QTGTGEGEQQQQAQCPQQLQLPPQHNFIPSEHQDQYQGLIHAPGRTHDPPAAQFYNSGGGFVWGQPQQPLTEGGVPS